MEGQLKPPALTNAHYVGPVGKSTASATHSPFVLLQACVRVMIVEDPNINVFSNGWESLISRTKKCVQPTVIGRKNLCLIFVSGV